MEYNSPDNDFIVMNTGVVESSINTEWFALTHVQENGVNVSVVGAPLYAFGKVANYITPPLSAVYCKMTGPDWIPIFEIANYYDYWGNWIDNNNSLESIPLSGQKISMRGQPSIFNNIRPQQIRITATNLDSGSGSTLTIINSEGQFMLNNEPIISNRWFELLPDSLAYSVDILTIQGADPGLDPDYPKIVLSNIEYFVPS